MKKLSGFLLAGGVLSLTLTSSTNGNEPPCEASRCVAVEVSQALAAVHEKVKAGVRIASQVKALENEAHALRIPRVGQTVIPVAAQAEEGDKDSAAQEEKAKKAEASGDDLAKIREEMAEVTRHMAKMKARDAEHQQQLELLESRLNEAAKKAESESKKLAAAADSLVLWEQRAERAETDLGSTKQAMQTLVKVAEDTKALNAQLQKQLSRGAAELAERDRRLSTTAASLQQVQAVAEESRARAAELQAELDNQTKRLETATAALKEVPALEGKIAELESTVAKHTQAEVLHEKQAKRMAASSEKMKARLNEILVEREELSDQLTILRNEFAQFRLDTKHAQVRTAKESVNQQQAALAQAQGLYHQALEKRNNRLTQLESSLEAKEHALQIAYGLENEALTKLEQSEKTRKDEAEVRQSLTLALQDLRDELELSRKKACQLNEQLIELESLHPE